EHLLGVAVYDTAGQVVAITPGLSDVFAKRPAIVEQAEKRNTGVGEFLTVNGTPLHIYALPLQRDKRDVGSFAVIYDASFVDVRVFHTLRDSLLSAFLQTLLIVGLTLFLVRTNFVAPLATTAKWLRHLRSDPSQMTQPLPEGDIFAQLHAEARHLARDLNT